MDNNRRDFLKTIGLGGFSLFGAGMIPVFLSSCSMKDVLDIKPLSSFSSDSVWKDIALIRAYLNNTYRVLPHGFQFNNRRLFCLTDESIARNNEPYKEIMEGNLTPSSVGQGPLDYWVGSSAAPGYYKCITQCNEILENVDKSQFDADEVNTLIGETKTLRAFSYFRLISFFGGVPLITKSFTLNDDYDLPRNSYADCFDFVIKELDEAINMLPLEYDTADSGRITKGAAMSIKSRALLFAASPLNNPENDKGKWQKASDAAKAVIDLNKYALYPDYKELFQEAGLYNSEQIWIRPFNHVIDNESVYIELRFYPNGYNGYGQIMVLQNLVDHYETLNGKLPINDPTFNSQNPYVNRDPRFYDTILYDGAPFQGRAVETFHPGGKDTNEGTISPWNASITGYYCRKYIDETIEHPTGTICSDPPWPFFRYAEILLNYAEAQYHLGNEDVCREYINKVRSRPSVNMPNVTESGEALLDRLRNERFIEFAFEGFRWFDPRRWKTATRPEVFNRQAYGIDIQKDTSGKKTYKVIQVEDRKFPESYYLVPIPRSEIEKDANLEQNPGY